METDTRPTATTNTGWWLLSTMIGLAALILAVIAVIGAFSDGTSAADSAASASTKFDVTLGDMYIAPATLTVPAGKTITVKVSNVGSMAHNFKVGGTVGTALLQPGTSETVTIGPFAADAEAWCSVPGHKAAGMLMKIVVQGAAGDPSTITTVAAGAQSGDAVIDPQAKPAADWKPRDPVLPAADTKATVHEIAMDATEKVMEVAPGVTQLMWTFNGQVPGPVLRGQVGDTFRITLTNRGTLGHSIDFHASKVAWDDEMRTIKPGESLVYEFKAEYAGIFMYHCGTAPTLHHIGNGMYGAIVVDPPGLAPVDQEFFMIQSELYLGPQGQPGDLTKMLKEQWDAVVFNGYHSQYKHAPIKVEAGKRYRVWVLDAGPSENSAFHIVGTIFDTVFKEGSYLLRPDDTHGGSQVLDLQAAQGGFVEFSFAEDGLYPFVTHKFVNPGKGALGFFAVGNADLTKLGLH